MSSTYPTDPYSSVKIVKGDFASQQACPTDRATALVTMDLLLMRRPMHINFDPVSKTDTSYVTGKDLAKQWMPDYSVGLYLDLTIDAYVSAGTGNWRLYDNTNSVAGTEIEVTNTGAYAESGPSRLVVQANELIALILQVKVTTPNTIYIRCNDRASLRFND